MTRARYLILIGILGGLIGALALAGWMHLAITKPHPCGEPVSAVILAGTSANVRTGVRHAVGARTSDGRVYSVTLPFVSVATGDRVNLQRICDANDHVLGVARVIPHSLRRVRDRAGG